MIELKPDAEDVWQRLETVRARRPRVHCITNAVAQTYTANMLLALGATPSMTIAPDEIGEFTARADALLINIGTLDAQRQQSIATAIAVAGDQGIPWVLDPVFAQASSQRRRLAQQLAEQAPTAIRANQPEFEALLDGPASAHDLERLAQDKSTTVAMTGEVDWITNGSVGIELPYGHEWMARVTAMGCAGSAVVGAFLGAGGDPLASTAAGLTCLGVAGMAAAEQCSGPGGFSIAYLDALYGLTRAQLDRYMENNSQ